MFLFSNESFGQTDISGRAELEREPVSENQLLLFKILVTNNTEGVITIPKTYLNLHQRKEYTEKDVGYTINGGSDLRSLCTFFVNGPLDITYQEVNSHDTKFINVLIPYNCFRKTKKYKISFFVKALKNKEYGKENYVEVKADIVFKIKKDIVARNVSK